MGKANRGLPIQQFVCYGKDMARPLRIELAGNLYHATSRSDRREDIFLSEGDRHLWLEIFVDVSKVQLDIKGLDT
jgi:hypothetical protein